MAKVKKQVGVPILTDVHDVSEIEAVSRDIADLGLVVTAVQA